MAKLKRITEVIGGSPFPEGSEPITDHLNQEMIIYGYELVETGFGLAAIVDAEVDGEKKLLTTFSGVLIRQLEEVGSEFPVIATPRKVKNYYTFV